MITIVQTTLYLPFSTFLPHSLSSIMAWGIKHSRRGLIRQPCSTLKTSTLEMFDHTAFDLNDSKNLTGVIQKVL